MAKPSPSLGDATLRAVEAHGSGISAKEIRDYLARELGLSVRPNHLGMALQRHRRAGRLDERNSQWWASQPPAGLNRCAGQAQKQEFGLVERDCANDSRAAFLSDTNEKTTLRRRC